VCDADPDGRRQGFPIAGRPRADGMLEQAEPGIFELACTSGALGKCVRFGYPPWASAGGTALREVYNACIRMVRADYCGDGTPTTKDGVRIDIYDDFGIQNEPEMDFEAGWTAQGAAGVRHVRVKEKVSLESLVAACPRLKDRVGLTCDEKAARDLGARLFNRSRP
jgi:ADYC domain